MDFGSKYVYDYDESDEECVSDDEFEEGMNCDVEAAAESAVGSSSGTCELRPERESAAKPKKGTFGQSFKKIFQSHRSSAPPPPPPPLPQRNAPSGGKGQKYHHWMSRKAAVGVNEGGQKWRRADTNVISVKFERLTAPSNMHTGDTIRCSGCSAVFSHLSKAVKGDDDDEQEMWKCEFCGESIELDIVEEEKPTEDDVTYMLQPAPSTQASGLSGTDQSLIVFCVDTSGSMCVTTEISGRIRMRGDHLARLQSLNEDREDQYLPRQNRNVTYLSRLQSVQAAVDHQLEELAKDFPDRRVALISFSSEVCVTGDGSGEPVHIAGDKLNNKDELTEIGSKLDLPNAVSTSKATLSNKIFELEEGGQTALGPALLVAIAMAGQAPGSKVIICTDGMANVGIGGLDVGSDQDAYSLANKFYTHAGEMATERGVSISVTSIKDTKCQLVELGKLAETTGGQVNIVDPLKLTEEFGNILADPVIATKVTATLLLHKNFYFRGEGGAKSENKMVKEVGNVTRETEITFEYGVHKKKKTKPQDGETSASAVPETSTAEEPLAEVPFQLQIEYTDLEGAQALRVVTQTKPVTTDREKAEKEINMPVIGAHAAQRTASSALKGEYTTSRMDALMKQRLLYRNIKSNEDTEVYDCYVGNVGAMENRLAEIQRTEVSTHGRRLSDDEDDVLGETDDVAALSLKETSKKKKKYLTRRMELSDSMAQCMYMQVQSKSKMKKPSPE